jgi:hypothetical protein
MIDIRDACMADFWESISFGEKESLCKMLNDDKFREFQVTPAILGMMPVLEVVDFIVKGPKTVSPAQSSADYEYEMAWRSQLLDRLLQRHEKVENTLWVPTPPTTR